MPRIVESLRVFEKRSAGSGSVLSVVSSDANLASVVQRLEANINLEDIKGALVFYACDPSQLKELTDEIGPLSDDVLTLMPGDSISHSSDPAAVLYWTILAHAADLGIVAPKGIKKPA